MNKGYPAAFGAYLFWGLAPVYWKIIASIPALEILAMRVLWSVPFLLLVLSIRRDFSVARIFLRDPWKYRAYFISPVLLAANWLVWIWAVSNGYVVDASLGYFINPLLNVALGVIFLHEHLRGGQWTALVLASLGVLYLAFSYGEFPWIALSLAGAFALYGYIRKTAPLGPVNGLTIEISVMVIPACLLLVLLAHQDALLLPDLDVKMHAWLSLTGLITVAPLIVFAYGARRIPYSTLGFIQYIAPTLQFILGIFVYHEVFSRHKFIGFSIIWLALIIYSSDNFMFYRRRKALRSEPGNR